MLAALALTALVEGVFFALTAYRREEYFMLLCCAVNVATNLSLNLCLRIGSWPPAWWSVAAGEILVVLIEYGIYAKATRPSRRLFLYTALANLLSFGLGLWLIPI